jgi:hypothetical protein
VPADVWKDGVSWESDWQELGFARWKSVKAEIDHQMARLVKNELKAQRIEEQNRRERAEMDKLLERYHRELAAPMIAKLRKRLDKAEREIRAGFAKIERNELLRRGVVKGRRQR